jgi:hypothetical protein
MRQTAVEEKFHVARYQSDGDSTRVQDAAERRWDSLQWAKASAKRAGRKQLRFEAIDALEARGEQPHRPRAICAAALQALPGRFATIDGVGNQVPTSTCSAQDGRPGFAASQGPAMCDRPSSLVFTADAEPHDGWCESWSLHGGTPGRGPGPWYLHPEAKERRMRPSPEGGYRVAPLDSGLESGRGYAAPPALFCLGRHGMHGDGRHVADGSRLGPRPAPVLEGLASCHPRAMIVAGFPVLVAA